MYMNQRNTVCACGKVHACALERLLIGKNAIAELPRVIRQYSCRRVFMLSDTLLSARLYQAAKTTVPSLDRGIAYARSFDREAWFEELTAFLGNGARDMIAQEAREQKYSTEKHGKRLAVILEKWDELVAIMEEEIPSPQLIEAILDQIGCPTAPDAWGVSNELLPMTFKATKDIRDKYVLSRLAFDLGILDELAALCGGKERS